MEEMGEAVYIYGSVAKQMPVGGEENKATRRKPGGRDSWKHFNTETTPSPVTAVMCRSLTVFGRKSQARGIEMDAKAGKMSKAALCGSDGETKIMQGRRGGRVALKVCKWHSISLEMSRRCLYPIRGQQQTKR